MYVLCLQQTTPVVLALVAVYVMIDAGLATRRLALADAALPRVSSPPDALRV